MTSCTDITVIIPTYNRINGLLNTLKAIEQNREIPEEIIIVDQSDDADEHRKILNKFFEECHFEDIKIINMDVPSSTKARNLGIKNAQNELIVFMDDDVELDSDFFHRLKKHMNDPDIAMIGALDNMACPNGNFFPYIFAMRSWRKRNQGHVVSSTFGRYPTSIDKMVPTEWAMGYCFAVRRSLIKKWELLFDENLSQYAYSEDLDFTFSYYRKSEREKLKCVLIPDIRVSHLCSKEWRTASKQITYVLVFNRYYLMKKHFGTAWAEAFFWWANIGLLIKKVIQKDNVKDFLCAMRDCVIFRSDICKGNLHTELYNRG